MNKEQRRAQIAAQARQRRDLGEVAAQHQRQLALDALSEPSAKEPPTLEALPAIGRRVPSAQTAADWRETLLSAPGLVVAWNELVVADPGIRLALLVFVEPPSHEAEFRA